MFRSMLNGVELSHILVERVWMKDHRHRSYFLGVSKQRLAEICLDVLLGVIL